MELQSLTQSRCVCTLEEVVGRKGGRGEKAEVAGVSARSLGAMDWKKGLPVLYYHYHYYGKEKIRARTTTIVVVVGSG